MLSILYIINPVDISGPLDDFGLTAPCLFTAALLINAARIVRKRAARRKRRVAMALIREIQESDAENFLVLCKQLDEQNNFMLLEPEERKTT
jgi:hypothetical protein